MKVVGHQLAAQTGVWNEQVAQQVDRDFGSWIEVEGIPETVPGGLVGINGHSETGLRHPWPLTFGDTRFKLDDGLVGGLGSVHSVGVQLDIDAEFSEKGSEVLFAHGFHLERALVRTEVVAEPAHVNERFVVESRAVLVVALEAC